MCSKVFLVEVIGEYAKYDMTYLMHKRKEFTKQKIVQYFNEAEIWDFIIQIFRGVKAAKEGGVIYDDIQPRNIMIQKKNDPGVMARYESGYRLMLLNPRYFDRRK